MAGAAGSAYRVANLVTGNADFDEPRARSDASCAASQIRAPVIVSRLSVMRPATALLQAVTMHCRALAHAVLKLARVATASLRALYVRTPYFQILREARQKHEVRADHFDLGHRLVARIALRWAPNDRADLRRVQVHAGARRPQVRRPSIAWGVRSGAK